MSATSMLVVCGGVVGSGVALLVREAVPAPARLGPALRRLNPPNDRGGSLEADPGAGRRLGGEWLVERAPGPLPRAHLLLIGQGPEQFLLTKAGLAMAGLLLPVMVAAGWALMGLGVSPFVPGLVGVLAAVALWFVPDWHVRDQAAKARVEFAHAAAAYLELVAMRMASNVGAAQALQEAARVGRGWAFTRIQDALLRARAQKSSPWEALDDLGDQLRLPVLADLADIMRLSSNDGAAVYDTLRARARSLRTELLAGQAAEANADSEKLSAPGALLAVIVMFAVAFPAVLNLMFL
ncbi:type II secretion system F family protein [Streptomyces sp. NPDC051907]|uniref:type II secretion system F family protein n=1 Tax=Streptomyces sp. NPDC051907 TaxID=3155284 RepID=UPI0034280185